MRNFCATLFLCTLLVPSAARSQARDTTQLGTVVVSATKTPSERASLTQAVTVLTGEELRAQGITRVSDALRTVPGAVLVQNGSVGSVNTLFMRGGESRYTKVLIDGVTVNAPGGFFDFSHLTTDNVERIEIVRGPASVVHGADAMTGIVQIFTRQGRGPLRGSAEARAGNRGTREASLDAGGSAGRARYTIGGGARRTDGVHSLNNNYYNGTLSGSAGFRPSDASDVYLTTRYTAAEFHYPTDFTGRPVDPDEYRVQHRLTAGLDASARLSPAVTGRVRLGSNEVSDLTEDQETWQDMGFEITRNYSTLSRNRRRSAEIGAAVILPVSSTLNLGAEYMRESERSIDAEGGPTGGSTSATFAGRRTNRAAYGELTGSVLSLASYTIAGRIDDNSDYDAHATYRAGASLPVGETTRFRVSLSTAFNAPAFNQLWPTRYTTGSPDLKPERSRSWEVRMDQTFAEGTVEVSAGYFRQRFTDMIHYVMGGPPSFDFSFANLAAAEANGFDAEGRARLTSFLTATAGYTFVRPRVTAVYPGYRGTLRKDQALLRRPPHSGSFSLALGPSRGKSLSVTGNFVGERPDMDFTRSEPVTVLLPRYFRTDLAGAIDVLRFDGGKSSLGMSFRVENILDTDYEDVFGFATPGRSFVLGARYTGAL